MQQGSILEQTHVAVTASHAHRQHFAPGWRGRKILFPKKRTDFAGSLG